jgi:hypothetical protein
MNSPQANPGRKRRRSRIAVVLLILGAVGTWFWPRGDARFVGTWTVEYADGGQWIKTLTFRRHGVVIADFAQGSAWPGVRTVSTVWNVRASQLHLGIPHVDRWQWLGNLSHSIVQKVSGSPADLIWEDLEIRTVGPDTIELLPLDRNGERRGPAMTLRRLAE